MISSVEQADVSRHKCLIYDGEPSEQLPVVVPLLMDGLHENWRCLYLGSPASIEMVGTALEERGVDTGAETQRRRLVLSSDRGHLAGGRFEPDAMIDSLCTMIDDAVRDGFRGLCATGDMRWELGDDENFDRLLEYEARLEQVFREKPLRGVCQYHRGMVPERALRDALVTHRAAWFGDLLDHDNLFYVPPELLLDARGHGDWMCRQILRVLDAERARDEVLRDLERRVAERTAELAVANRHLRAFSYSVAHDLRAPLRAIAGFATALSEDSGDRLDPDARKNVDRIVGGVRRMGELVDGMLALGRVVEADLRREPVDVSALAREVARELTDAEPTRDVSIAIAPGLRVVGDPVLVRAVVTNLLGNAMKFTSRRSEARIALGSEEREGGERVFFVRDNGAGFDMRFAQKLFGVFQRLHAQDEFPGTGVGLASVERIVARHGGRIWAEGRPDEGATFFFTLPSGESFSSSPSSP